MSRQAKRKLKELEESVALQQAAVLLLEKHNERKTTRRK